MYYFVLRQPFSSKFFSDSETTLLSPIRAIRFGNTMIPLKKSASSQTRSSFRAEPRNTKPMTKIL